MLFRKPPPIRKPLGDSGATAIEYAIIAALIGIGLIASLVSTKGSLSAVFGVASSNMGSANAQSGGGSASVAVPSYWAAKTLATSSKQANSYGGFTYGYVYSDGTRINFETHPNDSAQNFIMSTEDPATNQIRYASGNLQNQLSFVQVNQFTGAQPFSTYESQSYAYSPGQTAIGTNPLTAQYVSTQNFSNGTATTNTTTPTAALNAYLGNAQSDLTYFKAISN